MKNTEAFILLIGVAFLYLGFYRLLGFPVNEKLIVSLTVAAAAFALSEVFAYFEGVFSSLITKDRKNKYLFFEKLLDRLSFLFIGFAIMCIILLPSIDYWDKFSKEKLAQINDSATLISLGLSITLMGFKHIEFIAKRIDRSEIPKILESALDRFAEHLKNSFSALINEKSEKIKNEKEEPTDTNISH